MNKLLVLIFDFGRYTPKHLAAMEITLSESNLVAPVIADQLAQFMSTRQRREDFLPDAKPTILRLHEFGYRLALLTNRDPQFFPPIMLDGIGQCFELVLSAGQVAFWKPDARIFHAALEKLGKGLFPEATRPTEKCLAELVSLIDTRNHSFAAGKEDNEPRSH